MSRSVENSLHLAEDFASRAVLVKSFPAVMYLESTRGCPYKCIMCDVPQKYGRKSVDIKKQLLEKVSPYFQHLEILAMHGSGEPLLSKNIDFFIAASRKNDCFLHMNTTGFYLKSELADKLLSAKLHIAFSIHAGTHETYKKIMGNDLDMIIKNISYLTEKSARIGSRGNEFWFDYIVVNDTINEIDDFLCLANRAGITKVRFMRLISNKRNLKGAHIDSENFRYKYFNQFNKDVKKSFLAKLPHIQERAKELGISIEVGSMEFAAGQQTNTREVLHKAQRQLIPAISIFPLKRRRGNCLAPWAGQVQISQDGNVNLCCSTKYSLGNLYEKNFEDIWNDYQIRAVRGQFNNGLYPRVCGYCKGVPPDAYGIKLFESTQLGKVGRG
ncbi:MAG: radical SAM protein [Candidatus Brocadiaceae bacterium]|nr:radical SAM protein [Candidatus Brocadiaceae bacterium]